ncbi:MAG: hypothetical protein ABW187_02115 [Dokdonella sp.]
MLQRYLPFSSARTQLAAGSVLALLMVCTRGQHFASVNALPSASWAVLFLAGASLHPRWMFALLFALAAALDWGSYAAGTISDWCLSPAYWALLPAYGTSWLAGRTYARRHRDERSTIARLALLLTAAAFVAYLISGGCYYAFSGHYEPSFAGFVPRIAQYYPRALGTLAGYVGVAFALVVALRRIAARNAAAPQEVRA